MQTPKTKKPYQRPRLEGVSALESGSAICCKLTTGTCSNPAKNGSGKANRATDTT